MIRSLTSGHTLSGRVVRYGAAGIAATGVYALVVAGLVEAGLAGPVAAAVAGTGATIIFSYAVNRAWIFRTDRPHASAFVRFVVASGIGLGLNTGLMHLATQTLGWRYWAGLAMATLIVPPTNFLVNQHWAFRPSTRD